MRKYYIIAESGADLSREFIDKHQIRVLPMHVEMGGMDYTDGSISIEELCNYYNQTGKVPKTSAVSPHDYQLAYNEIIAENPDAIIIHICYSAQLSAAYQNSLIADTGKNRIFHIDSMNVSIGQAFVVMNTVKLIESNPDITPDEIVEHVKKCASAARFSFIPGNLDYLRAGGRVSNAQYLGATVLKLKPMIEVKSGKMYSTKKFRGSPKKLAQNMINDFFTKCEIDKDEIIFVYSLKIDDDLKVYMEECVKELGVKSIVWLQTGCVITSHAGPGAFGMSGIEKI